jgi:hypothetical protein
MYIKSGVLFIRLNSAPLSQELLLAKTKLIQLLNTEIGEQVINDVVFI